MVITVVDVCGRYFFNAPLRGSYEITGVGMAILVFAILPIVTSHGDNIRIELVPERWRGATQRPFELFSAIVSAVVFAGFSYALWTRAISLTSSGETSADLRMPLAPSAFGMCVIWFGCAIIVLAGIVRWRRQGRSVT